MRTRTVLLWSLLTFATVSVQAADVYIREDTWSATLMATRLRFQQDTGDLDVRLGPWHCTDGLFAGAFAKALFPEQGVDLQAKDGKGKALWEQRDYADGQVHRLSAGSACATYLYRAITAPQAGTLPVSLGSDDGIAVWLNGEEVLSKDVPRGVSPDQDHVTLALKAGRNDLLLKIYNQGGDHGFYFAAGTNPVASLWSQIARDFPRESQCLQHDSSGSHLSWLQEARPQATRELVARVIADMGHKQGLQKRLEATDNQDEAGLLDLYASLCRIRDGLSTVNLRALRMAVVDLTDTFGSRYAAGSDYLDRLTRIEQALEEGRDMETLAQQAAALQREALLANPLLDFDRILLVRRDVKGPSLGLPQNWQGNCALPRSGYDDEAAVMPMAVDGPLQTVFRPQTPNFVGDVDLHFDAGKMLFSMIGSHNRWQIWEVGLDGSNLRQVTPGGEDDVDNYDACYLPDERIIFASTRCFQGVPCVGGGNTVANLCIMNPDGTGIRQLCFDQDHNWCPTVMNDGRILYSRWEYSDTSHYFTRILFSMNPDGTNQMAYYGSNSYWPNSLFYARPIPNQPTQFAGIVSGHHGVARMGELHLFDVARGRFEADGVVQQIPGYGKKVEAKVVDQLVDGSWPKFLHPYPLSDKYMLAASQPTERSNWGIYLVDTFDNMLLLKEEPGRALLEPLPLRKTERPPVVPDRVDPRRQDAMVYLSDIYFGPGLKDVPRGAVKELRLYSFHYGYPQMGGHKNVAVEGGWDVHRILGTVPVSEDGSAFFRVPANTPIAVQPLDAQGRAMQIMRSWFTAMPGEILSCVGCHEQQNAASPVQYAAAARSKPSSIKLWRGPVRGFGFKQEVQPVLDRYCIGCHDGSKSNRPNFARQDKNGWGNFTPSYLALHPYVRRPGPESDYHLQEPMEYHANTSELVQMLSKGHHGVKLDDEAWDILYTWIDLNVPDHGTWSEHQQIPSNFHERRRQMRSQYAFLPDEEDPESIPSLTLKPMEFVKPAQQSQPPSDVHLAAWPLDTDQTKAMRQQAGKRLQRAIDLGDGVMMELAAIPSGRFVMGSDQGAADEAPRAIVEVNKPFWMGVCEVTNAQYQQFDPSHFNGYIDQQHKDHTTAGYSIGDPQHPAVRISWDEAIAFCDWLSRRTGRHFALPAEDQWEWACRAGTASPMSYGDPNTDFGPYANLADQSIRLLAVSGVNPQPIDNPSPYEDWMPKDNRFNDGQRIMCRVGQYRPNAWGLADMHGNVWEWTQSVYKPYPYRADDGRNAPSATGPRVVRGGSWYDRPQRATSSFRIAYEPWQKVFNVGFRVVCEMGPGDSGVAMIDE
ncbi:MAG: SUMF1/EgtB/PvdO family nonheme iron enzyme [Phycisphaerales bacterium]